MDYDTLVNDLGSPQPDVRLNSVRVIGMVDEVRALEALKLCYSMEDVAAVKEAIAWAGKRLMAVQKSGYSTREALFGHFGVTREIENATVDPNEKELLKRLESQHSAEMQKMQQDSALNQAGLTTAAMIGGALLGGAPLAMAALGSAMTPGANVLSSNLGQQRPETGKKRAPAMRPTDTNITVWARRLREDPDPLKRRKAAIELATINNPAALPYLALAFTTDTDAGVREAAQMYGKVLYWSMLYWQMEQDGSLQREMERRLNERRKALGLRPENTASTQPAAVSPQQPASPQKPAAKEASADDIAAILRQAEQGRKRRSRE